MFCEMALTALSALSTSKCIQMTGRMYTNIIQAQEVEGLDGQEAGGRIWTV